MKCRNCSVEVAPIFASALVQNKCPACGKEIMSGKDFQEMLRFRGLLKGLQLDDKLVITISAALSSRFDLVPKATDGYGEVIEPPEPKKATMTEEQIIRNKALKAAKEERDSALEQEIAKEWGLDQPLPPKIAAKRPVMKKPPPKELVELFDNDFEPLEDAQEASFTPTGSIDRQQRLAAAEAARNDPGKFKVRRAGYEYGD